MYRPQKLPVASPRGGKRGCLCPDNTYRSECCDGTIQAQGIGSLLNQGISVKIQGEEWQTINTLWQVTNTLWQDL